MGVYGCSKKAMNARKFLYKHLLNESERYFGNTNEKWLSHVCEAWMNDESNSKHRYDAMRSMIGDETLRRSRILDMSSGCGTFVFYGLMNGYDLFGTEPEKWKHQFNFLKAKEKGYPDVWMKRFVVGVGEYLPFKHGAFDIISTYQTLEHVQSLQRCFGEFKRVLRKGGYLFIGCPDYASFFEGHYRLPMLPLMNRSLFKIYLKTLKRPTRGLDIINYTTRKRVFRLLLDNDFEIDDIALIKVKSIIHNKFKCNSNSLVRLYLAYSQIAHIFRREKNIQLFAIKT